jgi:hypothetical protein
VTVPALTHGSVLLALTDNKESKCAGMKFLGNLAGYTNTLKDQIRDTRIRLNVFILNNTFRNSGNWRHSVWKEWNLFVYDK